MLSRKGRDSQDPTFARCGIMTEPWVPEGGGSEMSGDAEDRGGRQGGGPGEHCFSFPSEAPRLMHAVNPNLISDQSNEKKGS